MNAQEQAEQYRQDEARTERFIFAMLHGVPTDQRPIFLAALAGNLAKELTREEMITFTSNCHRYY